MPAMAFLPPLGRPSRMFLSTELKVPHVIFRLALG
jgi:hypothetical protein